MARGQNLSIPASSNVLIDTLSREVKNSAAILNPNDGVIYVRLNSRIIDVNPASWDWKLPSQSYGIFPGPWQSLGLFYLDQSGSGRQGEITVYDSDVKLDVPDIHSIGRALQAQSTTLDVVEATIPANPSLGIARIWADVLSHLHSLDNTGTDRTLIDTSTPLGGVLTAFLPNAGLAANSVFNAQIGVGSIGADRIANNAITSTQIGFTFASFIPTLQQGVGLTLSTASGWYIQLGKIIFGYLDIVINGAGTASNNFILTGLPAAARAVYIGAPAIGRYFKSAGTTHYVILGYLASASSISFVTHLATGTFGVNPAITAAVGDELHLNFFYESA